MDLTTLTLAKKYTRDTAIGLGAVKGASCTISSIEETNEGSIVTFKWTAIDGTEQTSVMNVKGGGGGAIQEISETEIEALFKEIVS